MFCMDAFLALAEPNRRKIMELLAANGNLSATDIYKKFKSTPPAVSQHLKVLTDAGLLTMRREGQFNYYRFVRDTLEAYRNTLGTSFESTSSLS